jgi:hypothetical protein
MGASTIIPYVTTGGSLRYHPGFSSRVLLRKRIPPQSDMGAMRETGSGDSGIIARTTEKTSGIRGVRSNRKNGSDIRMRGGLFDENRPPLCRSDILTLSGGGLS